MDKSAVFDKKGPSDGKDYPDKSLLGNRSVAEYKMGGAMAIRIIKNGISQRQLLYLKNQTGLDYNILAFIVGVTKQTLIKKAVDYTYHVQESDKLFQIAELYSYGYNVFENKEGFNSWMRTENAALGNRRPIDHLDTSYGFNEVKDLLGRIEYGVYS
ncbi:type II RES/Xre toxin-antitoxin system antitoxin [Niabella hirudinis]|uniref:type II RES/Xre toxin-antitoxin system antitoxin n=1 Tax=Niabella hirudinis TaxID=1285929 RepID=UPI003EB79F17